MSFPSSQEIETAFSSAGMMGGMYHAYERRDEQVEMTLAIRNALAASDDLVVEAGTGVGKSMAYLIPAALTALQNDITVGVATKTNALLDQLMYKGASRSRPGFGSSSGQKKKMAACSLLLRSKGFLITRV